MRKGLVALVVVFIGVLWVSAQPDVPIAPSLHKVYLDEIGLIARWGITKQFCYRYELINGTVTNNRYQYREIKFLADGNIKELIHIDNKGIHQSIITFTYYPNKLPKAESEFTPEGQMVGRRVYRYDSQGFLSEVVNYNQGGYIISKTMYTRDSTKQSITRKYYTSPDEVESAITYYFDGFTSGKIIQVDEWDEHGKMRYSKKLVYDKDHLIEEQYTLSEGRAGYRVIYAYTPAGEIKEAVRMNADRSQQVVFTNQYNEKGLLEAAIRYDQRKSIRDYVKYRYE